MCQCSMEHSSTGLPAFLSVREKLILAGLYLSKYDKQGLDKLGFEGFTEAFNVIGFALASKPTSINNYRDEFDHCSQIPERVGISAQRALTASRFLSGTRIWISNRSPA